MKRRANRRIETKKNGGENIYNDSDDVDKATTGKKKSM